MKRYLGVKLIETKPMTHGDYAKEKYGESKIETDFSKENKDKEGYKVVYQDGHVSWSPKEVFEKAYSTCGKEGFVSVRVDLQSGEWEFLPIEETSQKEMMIEKMLDISEVKQAKDNISDLKVYGDGDTFALLCKASSQEQGWMKSTKVCNTPTGCIVQVTTQQKNPDGSYSVAEALIFVPNTHIDTTVEPRVLIPWFN